MPTAGSKQLEFWSLVAPLKRDDMTFAHTLVDFALAQHHEFQFLTEDHPKLCNQIKQFWNQTVGGFTSCTDVPWSAVFVSFCVKKAGATAAEFKFAAAHSVFV